MEVTSSGPARPPNTASPVADHPRAPDTNREYCRRLAEIVDALVRKAQGAGAELQVAASGAAGSLQRRAARAPSTETPLLLADVRAMFGPSCTYLPEGLPTVEQWAAALEHCPDVQARLAVSTQYTASKWVLERELEACALWPHKPEGLHESKTWAYAPCAGGKPDAYAVARLRDAAGMCLSGGGIRSATFCLGILQGFARHSRVGKFDYLSSVSGGGYIHQFLANWVYKAGDMGKVEAMLDPIPNEPGPYPAGGNATVQPEPLRWLRRYSNYLAPRKGIFSLDTWTIAATWARNTVLNFVVLLSGLFCLMLLPHLGTIPFAPLAPHPWVIIIARSLLALLFAYIVFHINKWLRDLKPPGARPLHIKLACASLLGAAVLVSPSVYRSSIPDGSVMSERAHRVFARSDGGLHLHFQSTLERETPQHETVEVTVDEKGADEDSRMGRHWGAHPRPFWKLLEEPRYLVPLALFAFLCGTLFFSMVFVESSYAHDAEAATPIGLEGAFPQAQRWWRKPMTFLWGLVRGSAICFGFVFAVLLIDSIRLTFFAACFAVPLHLIPSLAVVMLPPILLGVPFVLMELGLGLLGRAADSSQREWLARLRAFSFMLAAGWALFTFFSLFGFYLFRMASNSIAASSTVWGGWLLTTAAGVLSGRSKRTEDTPDKAGESSKGSTVLNLLAHFAPPVFLIGLLVLISAAAEWAIHAPGGDLHKREFLFVLMFVSSLAIALLFGWRIDINDFSMHAFYRDRLARCYGGAVDPDRKANLFTGFTNKDRWLRVHQLLPRGYTRKRADGKEIAGTYDGPFPIISTAINLTTGEDLAYQERKAGSFGFTPLYSGYSVGWTAARSNLNQYNGFVDTESYAYPEHGGITVATACAISGAAASPNMGYHTSPVVAFLLTVFNVRLGWWLRNPRRRRVWTTTPYVSALNEPISFRLLPWLRIRPKMGWPKSSPQFGLINLTSELLGQANDTSPYVYLSDGGHFDNMGLYELLRRRCRRIVIVDGEEDGKLTFEGLGMAIRKARLDFGVEVTLDDTGAVGHTAHKHDNDSGFQAHTAGGPRQEERGGDKPEPSTDPAARISEGEQSPQPEGAATLPQPMAVTAQMSSTDASKITGTVTQEASSLEEGIGRFQLFPAKTIHCVHGTIRYPEDTHTSEFGQVLYIKASLTGDEPPDILNYRREHESFPHDTTLNQFFTESEFESYRRLGEHIALNDPVVGSWLKHYIDQAHHAAGPHA